MLFISKYKGLRIVLKAARTIVVDNHRMLETGKTVEFQNGLYETNDPEEIKALKGYKRYGIDYWTDSKQADEPSVEGVREVNDEKAVAEAIGSKCDWCGKDYKTQFALENHQKACPRRPNA